MFEDAKDRHGREDLSAGVLAEVAGAFVLTGDAALAVFYEEYRSQKDQQVPKTLARIPGGIHRDWIESIKNGTKACSDFSYSGPLTETILLGSLAIRTGMGFAWDAANMEITGNPAAAAWIKIEARKGWRPEDLA